MKKLDCEISVADWVFDFVTEIEVVSSWDLLTDTCKIELPKNVSYTRDDVILENIIGGDNPVFNRGDRVIVKLGYDGDLKVVFMGWLSDVIPNKPIVLMCEDDMYRCKQAFVESKVAFENATLSEFLDELFNQSSGS